MWLRWFAVPVLALAGVGVLGLALAGFVILLAYPNLPSIEALTEYQPKIPLRVYTADGVLIGEFGEERRSVVSIEEVQIGRASCRESRENSGQGGKLKQR